MLPLIVNTGANSQLLNEVDKSRSWFTRTKCDHEKNTEGLCFCKEKDGEVMYRWAPYYRTCVKAATCEEVFGRVRRDVPDLDELPE